MIGIHFIGIGGTGMSGLANIALDMGLRVSGSDTNNSETVKKLIIKGAFVHIGHKRGLMPIGTDTVVYSTAISNDNPELLEAKELGIEILHRSDFLAYVAKNKISIGVAGAHGKTTTTTMLSEIFEKAGFAPSVAAGGKLLKKGTNGYYRSDTEILIAELDESDGSFLKIPIKSTIVTNIDNDHLDYYKSQKNIDNAFEEFMNGIKGTIVINGGDEKLVRLSKNRENVITFGFTEDCDYVLKNIKVENYRNTGKVFYRNHYIGTINIPLPGKHNLENALGALALSRCEGVPDEVIFKAFDTLDGVGRRFEIVGQKNGITLVDDYAHHPSEISALINGAKSFGYARVIAIFQPHRYTRTKALYNDFIKALKLADIVLISDIYSAGEGPVEGINSEILVSDIGAKATYCKDFPFIVELVKKISSEEDIILTIGAGDISNIGKGIIEVL